jgi:hypothetical protein
MGTEITIRGDSLAIRLAVIGYENPEATDVDDANWLAVTATVEAPGLFASTKLSLVAAELKEFRDQLRMSQETLAGSARLESLEQAISVNVVYGSLGRARISGELRLNGGESLKLTFSGETDQTLLQSVLVALDEAVSAYPEIKTYRFTESAVRPS